MDLTPVTPMQLSLAAKAAGARLGYRVLVTAVDLSQGTAQQGGGGAGDGKTYLLGPEEVLVLPDLVAIGPVNTEASKG